LFVCCALLRWDLFAPWFTFGRAQDYDIRLDDGIPLESFRRRFDLSSTIRFVSFLRSFRVKAKGEMGRVMMGEGGLFDVETLGVSTWSGWMS